jgi:hypothetical protein
MVAESAQAYMRVFERNDESEQEQLRSLCSVLAEFLDRLLDRDDRWSRYKWVDAIVPTALSVPSIGELSIRGKMIWAERGQTREWIEPFLAHVQIPAAGQDTFRFKIFCGDASRGLGTVPYSMSPGRATLADPGKWLFTFTEESCPDLRDQT